MTKSDFRTIWDEYFKNVKNAKGTYPDKALQMYCAYLKEKGDSSLTCTDFLRKVGKNPEAPLFGYTSAASAIYNAKYHMTNLRLVCKGEDFLDLVGDWKEEPALFPTEEQTAPVQDKTETEKEVEHISRTMTVIAMKLNDITDLLDTLVKRFSKEEAV